MAVVLIRASKKVEREVPVRTFLVQGDIGRARAEGEPARATETTTEEGTTGGASDTAVTPADWPWWLIGLALLVGGILLGTRYHGEDYGPTFSLQPGISAFVLFYVFAQALERLAEFVSYIPFIGARWKGGETTTKDDAATGRDQATVQAVTELAEGNDEKAKRQAEEAAEKQHDLDVIRSNRAVFFFCAISAAAAILAGYFEVLFLTLVGVTNLAIQWDIAITALAIGGGSKPLHDLITNIQKAKEEKEDGPKAIPL